MVFQKDGSTLQIIEKNSLQLVYGLGACCIGIVLAVIGLATIGFSAQLLPFIVVGILFTIFGIFMVRYVETRTVTITSDGAITIEYKRMIGDKQWMRRLDRADIRSLDYVKGFDGSKPIIHGERWDTLYLNVIFDEQIEIAKRFMVEWTVNKFGIPFYKRSVPLDAEATEIGNLLGIPINIISSEKVRDAPHSIYIPRDKMAYLMQRPTQAQLDHERDVKK